MDAISLVLEALVAGGANGKIQEAFSHLKERLMDTFAKQESPDARLCAEIALKQYQKDPEVWKEPLKKALTDADIEQNSEIIQVAQKLLQEVASDREHVIQSIQNKGVVKNQTIIGNVECFETKTRPLGILKGKASYKIKDDFQITDDELLSS